MWDIIFNLVCFYFGTRVGISRFTDSSINNQIFKMQDRVDIANEERDKALDLAKSWERRYNYLVSIQENKNEYDAV
jgi:hypothetical protein